MRRRHSRPRACIVRQSDLYETPLRREAEALVSAGYAVDVLVMRHPERPRRVAMNGVDVTSLPTSLAHAGGKVRYVIDYGRFFCLVAGTLAGRHLRRPYAVIQVNSMPDFLVFAAVVPKLLGSRVVAGMKEPTPELAWTLYGSHRLTAVLARIEQRALRFADHAIAVTEGHRERYIERGADGRRISVVLNGIDREMLLAGWTPPADRRADGRFVVICHGTIEDRYGQDTIVEAAALLRDEIPGLEVVLTGRGSDVPRVLDLAAKLCVDDIVRFEGWVTPERLNDLLHAADVGVVAQKASPYSHLVHTNKMMDYWIFGLPVVASRLRATAASYGDDQLEFFTPGDAADLAAALQRVHADPARRRALAEAGEVALETNGWGVQRRTYLGVFASLVGIPRRARTAGATAAES
jgi:glycosyltransferase involved in cell wall biosynthesis